MELQHGHGHPVSENSWRRSQAVRAHRVHVSNVRPIPVQLLFGAFVRRDQRAHGFRCRDSQEERAESHVEVGKDPSRQRRRLPRQRELPEQAPPHNVPSARARGASQEGEDHVGPLARYRRSACAHHEVAQETVETRPHKRSVPIPDDEL